MHDGASHDTNHRKPPFGAAFCYVIAVTDNDQMPTQSFGIREAVSISKE